MTKRNGKLKTMVDKLNAISQSRSELLDKLWTLEQEGIKLRIDIKHYIDTWSGENMKEEVKKAIKEEKQK